MKVIAEKSNDNYITYILPLFFSTVFIINGFITEYGYIMIIIGLLLLLYPIIDFIRIKKLPLDIIKYNEMNNTLIIKEKYILNISRIIDISYSKYLTGIIIKTSYETYRCLPVKNPIDCYDKLMEIRYKKYKGE